MKDWRLHALPDLVAYLLAAALLGLFVGLAIRLEVSSSVCGLIPARLTTYTYDVDKQLNRARNLSRARFTSKIDHVTDK
jgi:glucose-6-phosphate-specific signal transduction histidine kinase